ncbi:MAG: efflux RND transporter periplasmic adaptor subunit [Phycisphaerae bacterium]
MNDKPDNRPTRPTPGRRVGIILGIILIAGACLWVAARYGDDIYGSILRATGRGEQDRAENDAQWYTCGMHPWVVLPDPGQCPICQMDLVPLDPDKFSGEVTIDPVVVQNMGVRVRPVTQGPLTKEIRTVGTVDYREPNVRDVNIKVSGWIEKLYVDHVGAPVEKGEPLFELYSPQLYAAQEEYLLAWRNRDRGPQQRELLESARTRLEYFDVSDEQIERLVQAGQPAKTMTLDSPHKGVVIDKHAAEGMKVDPGMRAFRIADLSKVWVMVTLYEFQLPYVREGQSAVMTLPYIPGQEFTGEVVYIYPTVDRDTREVRLRLEFENPNGLLKPGMFTTVKLHSTLARERMLAPRSAVIDTGEREVALVWRGKGRFEPRDVETGIAAADDMVEIIDGLKPGEMVVTSGQFLIDSEAKLRESLARMMRDDLAADKRAPVEVVGDGELVALPETATEALTEALREYLAIQQTLSEDSTEGVSDSAQSMARALDRLIETDIPDRPHFWHENTSAAEARSNALKLVESDDLSDARLRFADVGTALTRFLEVTGVPAEIGELQVLRCPMYQQGQGGTWWMQTGDEVRNPYFGPRMLGCYDERKALPPAPRDTANGAHDMEH